MLFDVIRTHRGKSTVVFTGDRQKANDRMALLKKSGCGAAFSLRPSGTTEKYKKIHKFRSH